MIDYPSVVKNIKQAVQTVPVIAKWRVGHFVEAIGVDYIDENEALPAVNHTMAEENFRSTPLICGCDSAVEALRMARDGNVAILRTRVDSVSSGSIHRTV